MNHKFAKAKTEMATNADLRRPTIDKGQSDASIHVRNERVPQVGQLVALALLLNTRLSADGAEDWVFAPFGADAAGFRSLDRRQPARLLRWG